MILEQLEVFVVHTYTMYLLTVPADAVLHRWVEVMAVYAVALWVSELLIHPPEPLAIRAYYVVAPAAFAYTAYALATYETECPQIFVLMYYYLLGTGILCFRFLFIPRVLLEQNGVFDEHRRA